MDFKARTSKPKGGRGAANKNPTTSKSGRAGDMAKRAGKAISDGAKQAYNSHANKSLDGKVSFGKSLVKAITVLAVGYYTVTIALKVLILNQFGIAVLFSTFLKFAFVMAIIVHFVSSILAFRDIKGAYIIIADMEASSQKEARMTLLHANVSQVVGGLYFWIAIFVGETMASDYMISLTKQILIP